MELINCNKWRTLCDHVYDSPELIFPEKDSVVYVPCDHIGRFFYECNKIKPKAKFIVISACSDYGPVLQEEHPIWFDMKKWFDFQPVDASQAYNPLLIPARCNNAMCKITDKYSIKMHTFTQCTFNEIPSEIKAWYCTNANINDAIQIPFGIPDWSEKLILEARSKNLHIDTDKSIGVYVNFQNNTSERVSIKNQYMNNKNISIKVISDEITHEEYINNLLKSVYVLSPTGNGQDCYRTLESIYCGAIPIIPDSIFSLAYKNLPVFRVGSYGLLEKVIEAYGYKVHQTDLTGTPADFGFWRQNVDEKRKMLGIGLDID